MNEEDAVAIMMASLKGGKNKPVNLLKFAEACRFLLLHEKWKLKEMSRYFRVSEYMLRQIDKINDVAKESPKVKQLIRKRQLGIEASYQLSRIEEPKRTRVANMLKDMTTDEIRRFVYFIVHNSKLSLEECRKLFEEEKPEKIELLVLPLDSQTYENLKKFAKSSKLKIHDYALKILKEKVNGK